MGRTAGRSPDETRKALLAAAGEMIRLRGVSATLGEIARHAGVSKGGLLYHFAGKDELLAALAGSLLDGFRAEIEARLDPADTGPGRWTRAYVRAVLAPADEAEARRELALIAQLSTLPAVAELARADADRMDADLRADGLPDDVRTLVVAAADGLSVAPIWGVSHDDAERRALERRLLELTMPGGSP